MLRKCLLGVLVALLTACAGKSQSSSAAGGAAGSDAVGANTLSACEPLVGGTTSVELDASQVVAAGQASDGTVYVIYGGRRLFVGSPQNLTEQVVLGSGETQGQTDLSYAEQDGTPVTVELARVSTGPQMVVAHGAQKGKGVDEGNGETLTMLKPALVESMTASTAHTFQVDFAASLPDARELVVVAPVHFGDYDQFRVFFGPPDALVQRVTTNFGSSQSGQRYASVSIDGALADLTYLAGGPSELNPSPAPSTLTIADVAYPLTEGPVPGSASFQCFSK